MNVSSVTIAGTPKIVKFDVAPFLSRGNCNNLCTSPTGHFNHSHSYSTPYSMLMLKIWRATQTRSCLHPDTPRTWKYTSSSAEGLEEKYRVLLNKSRAPKRKVSGKAMRSWRPLSSSLWGEISHTERMGFWNITGTEQDLWDVSQPQIPAKVSIRNNPIFNFTHRY